MHHAIKSIDKSSKIFLILAFLSIFFNGSNCLAQENNSDLQKFTQESLFKINFLSVNMPENEDNLGLAGIHYNLLINDWSYVGIGMYAGITGIRGGLFTLGVNAGIRKNIIKNLFLDTGIHFGGGGGSGAPDGGGAYILPHFNLGYQFPKFSIEGGYSYINFFDKGDIESHQLNLAVQIPLSYDYTSFKNSENTININDSMKNSDWYQKSKKISMLMHFNNLKLIGKTKDDEGVLITDKTIRTVGAELNTYFNNHSFFYLKADGAYYGIDSGYMDLIIGLGYKLAFNQDRTRLIGKFGVGAAGGGGVDIQGGFIISPDISLEQKVYKNLSIFVNTGFLMNPNAHFSAYTYGLGLKYDVNQNGLLSSDGNRFNTAKFKGKEIIFGQEVYSNVANRIVDPYNMYQVFLQFNFYINKNIYASGQTSFANFGYAGAYAEGLVGAGLSTSNGFSKRFQLFAQALIGAAGGGHIETGQGLIVKPSGGVSFFINDKLGLRTSVGQTIALDGDLNSTFVNFGISYRFATLKAN